MSRCSERWPAAAVALAAVLVLPAGVADAAPSAPVVPVTAPVQTIVAPVLDIAVRDADLDRAAQVQQQPRRTVVTLDTSVLFGRDSARLTAAARVRLREVADDLLAKGPGRLTVTGYTDDLGSRAHGRTLSRQRAAAVAGALRPTLPEPDYPARLVAKGEDDPAVPNTSERNRRINRRVVLLYEGR